MCVCYKYILYYMWGGEKKSKNEKTKCDKILELLSIHKDGTGVHFSVLPTFL